MLYHLSLKGNLYNSIFVEPTLIIFTSLFLSCVYDVHRSIPSVGRVRSPRYYKGRVSLPKRMNFWTCSEGGGGHYGLGGHIIKNAKVRMKP